MKWLILLCSMSFKNVVASELNGEWSLCSAGKGDVIIYTTIFTKNFRHEIVIFGTGDSCKDINTTAYAASITVSKIIIKNNFVTHQRIKDSFVALDERRRTLLGTAQKCIFSDWIKTLDKSCELDGDFDPETKEALVADMDRRNGVPLSVFIKNNVLHEDLFKQKGLSPSTLFDLKLFK